jgi:multidrug resistance efflux pump
MNRRADNLRTVNALGRAVKDFNCADRNLLAAVERHQQATANLLQSGKEPPPPSVARLKARLAEILAQVERLDERLDRKGRFP